MSEELVEGAAMILALPVRVHLLFRAVHRTTDGSHLVTDELAAAHAFQARPTPRPTTPQEPT